MLEYAIRPFQSPGSHGKIIIAKTPGATTARATITWGSKTTNLPAATGGVTVQCCSDSLDEQERTGETVRIFGNDDPGDGSGPSFVDVFRANTVKLNKQSVDNCSWGPIDQYLTAEYAPFLGLTPDDPAEADANCTAKWKLNNNTTAAGAG